MRSGFRLRRPVARLFRRPELETLEERCVPASVAVGDGGVQKPDVVTTGAVRPGFDTINEIKTYLPGNDDSSVYVPDIGFQVNLGGVAYNSLYVNNNGNITFAAPLSAYTPFPLSTTNRAIIAPFFADVYTVGSLYPNQGSGPADIVTYGTGTVDGHQAFGVTWDSVGYFAAHTDKLNTFQVVLINRYDNLPGDQNNQVGDVDVELNYNQIQWDTGDASGGRNGLAIPNEGTSARVGYSDGVGSAFELAGSAVPNAFLDSSDTGLVNNSFVTSIANSQADLVSGRYVFTSRAGAFVGMPLTFAAGASADAFVSPGSTTFTDNIDFTDLSNPSSWNVSIDYGDNTGIVNSTLYNQQSEVNPQADPTVALNHQYAANGSYAVTVTVSDNFGSFTDHFNVHVGIPGNDLAASTSFSSNANQPTTESLTDPSTGTTASIQAQGEAQVFLGFYTQNPSSNTTRTGQFLDIQIGNPQGLTSLILTITPQGPGPFEIGFLNSAGRWVNVPYTVLPNGDLQVVFTDFTIFNNTVFVVSLANAVAQPTILTSATARANTTTSTASDVGPGVVQTLSFTSTTQLSVTVSAAEDSQEIRTSNIQGSPSTSSSPGAGKRLAPLLDGDDQNLEQQALWFQYGDEAPWWLTAPVQQAGKQDTPMPPIPMSGQEDETSLEPSLTLPVAIALPPQAPAQGMAAEPNIWATLPEYGFWAGPSPTLRMTPEWNTAAPQPASALALPLLALGAGMATAHRDKPAVRRPGASWKDVGRSPTERPKGKMKTSAPTPTGAQGWLVVLLFLSFLIAAA
jgi:Nidogen-like